VEAQTAALPTAEERTLVASAAAIARASAYNVEAVCGANPCAPPEGPPPDATRHSPGVRRAGHINGSVIKADAWGCIVGGGRGFAGGPPGVAAGCFTGALIGSGGVIWNHLM
jgi:hypothetical protein